jgi:ribosomal RNA-processing protein 1
MQEELAERLAAMMPQMQQPMSLLYFSAFMAIMRTEWANMDHHRLNKFLMLVRKFIASLFSMFKSSGW